MPRLLSRLTVVLALLGGADAFATVLVPMSDADLVHTSTVIATGTVERMESAGLPGGRIHTRISLAVEAVVKGRGVGRTLEFHQPGGRLGDRTAHVFGAAEFAPGERVLVFLARGRDGALRPNALALGKYRIETGPGGTTVARRTTPTADVRDLGRFLDRLGALAADDPGEAVPPAAPAALVTAPFTLLGTPPARWFGQTVVFGVANAEAALGPSTSQTILADAFAAWTNVASAAIDPQAGGSTPAAPSIAGGACDGVSTVQFNDPFDEISDLAGCTGVLAVAGYCASGETTVVNGTTFRRIVEGDLTVNDGVGACFGAVHTAEVLTHEAGHAIGLGHSSEDAGEPDPALEDATMYFLAHFDGRGAALRADDVAGVAFVYPGSAGPDADGDGVGDAADQCPGTPAGLAVDAAGCACTDPGHASCDDGDPCTTDSCRPDTGSCIQTFVDCSDADPCTYDGCDAAGSCVHTPAGDQDGDGICDPLDDGDGDGVPDSQDRCGASPAGVAVDPTGCACADPGHAPCADADPCTEDGCDAASAACVHGPPTCDDGDPCTADACTGAAGCTHAPASDTDGDGLCDAADACPRLPGAAATDLDGDGIGDDCECRQGAPGRCVPGQGQPGRRCFVEWLPSAPAPVRHALPAPRLGCTDGDPACDLDTVAGQCTFETLLCINNQDPRFPGCIPFDTTTLTVRSPAPGRPRDAADEANAATLAAALDLSAQSRDFCSAPLRLVVPTRGTRPGARTFKVTTRTLTHPGRARLRLVCDPAPVG
jgi:hypothetical protein